MKPTIPKKNSKRNRQKTKNKQTKNKPEEPVVNAEFIDFMWDAYEKTQGMFPDSISTRKTLDYGDVTTEIGTISVSGGLEIKYTFLLFDKNHESVIKLQEGRTMKGVVEINRVPALNRVRYVVKIKEVRRPFRLSFPFYITLRWPKTLWRKVVVSILKLPSKDTNFPSYVKTLSKNSLMESTSFIVVED